MIALWFGWWFGCQSTPPLDDKIEPISIAKGNNPHEKDVSTSIVPVAKNTPPIPPSQNFTGIPKELLKDEISNDAVRELQQRFGDKGWFIEMHEGKLTVELDYATLFKNRPDLTLWTKYITEASDIDQRVRSYVKYVQNLTYSSPPLYVEDKMIAEYWTPSEVLENQSGDCDSLSMLLVSLVAVEQVPSILLYNSDANVQHMVVGIAISPTEGELVTEIDGRRYVVFDTTINHPPTETQRVFFEEHTFNVIQLSL